MEEEGVIDFCQHQLQHIGDGFTVDESTKELYLMGCTLKKMENLEKGINLKILHLRNNAIEKLENIEQCIALEDLDCYGNQIKHIPAGLSMCTSLKKIDLSFNSIRKVENLSASLQKVEELYLINNKIKDISGCELEYSTEENTNSEEELVRHRVAKVIHEGADPFEELASLRLLELGANRIRSLQYAFRAAKTAAYGTTMRELWLGKNKIEKIENLQFFKNLKILSLQNNRITKIENLDGLGNCLEELYVSENGISTIENISALKKLRLLDISQNKITSLEGLQPLAEQLDELWCSFNKIETFQEVDRVLGKFTKLNDVHFTGNPIRRDVQYKRKMELTIPSLKNIDGFPILKSQQ